MPTTLKLGETIFEIEELDAATTFDLQPILIPPLTQALEKVVPTIAKLFEAARAEGTGGVADAMRQAIEEADIDLEAEGERIVRAIGAMFMQLPPDHLRLLRERLLSATFYTNPGGQRMPLFSPTGNAFNAVMRGRTIDTWRLLWVSVRLNYPDFFGLLGAKSGASPAPAPSATLGT